MSMSIGKKFKLLNFGLIGLIAILGITILLAVLNQRALNQAQEVRYESYLLANELRQSSDDLTRLARTYVVTRDSKYEQIYWEILDVRNGKKPRPDGRTASLRSLMEKLGFTAEEFSKLKEAENNSNALVTTETIAMNAIKGLFDDGTGNYTRPGLPNPELARRIMHDEKYHQDKEIIMKPIRQFEDMLNSRTAHTVEQYAFQGNFLLSSLGVLILITALTIFLTLRSVNGVLSQIVRNLHESVGETSEYAKELVSTSQTLSSVSTEQAAAIQETVSTLNEINAMVDKSSENAKKSTQVSNSSRASAEEGKRSVQEMISSIQEIGTNNHEMVKQIESGNQQLSQIIDIISQIGNKTKVINDIVFQTKLLSFNASVEAARAGEQGKGFAVVAEEVGNLAQMSGTSAKEISDMLNEGIARVESIIKETTRNTEEIASHSKTKIEKGTEIASRCEATLNHVVEIVDQVNQFVTEISKASQEQAKGVNEITKAMQDLDQTTAESAAMSEKTAGFANNLGTNTQRLRELIHSIEKDILGVSHEGI